MTRRPDELLQPEAYSIHGGDGTGMKEASVMTGKWRIESMPLWDKEFLDMIEPA